MRANVFFNGEASTGPISVTISGTPRKPRADQIPAKPRSSPGTRRWYGAGVLTSPIIDGTVGRDSVYRGRRLEVREQEVREVRTASSDAEVEGSVTIGGTDSNYGGLMDLAVDQGQGEVIQAQEEDITGLSPMQVNGPDTHRGAVVVWSPKEGNNSNSSGYNGDGSSEEEKSGKEARSKGKIARNNNHLIRNTVDTWLEQADPLFEEATQLKSEAGDINSWWKGWVTCSRFSLGRKAAKKNVDIQKHLGEGSKFGENNVSDARPVQSYEPEPVGDFKTFASREATKSEVIAALRADENSLVGIYGMPGVGKTMLMKAVMAQLKKEKVFDEVVMVVVSQKPVLETIQDAIAEKLDLKFTGNLRSTKAAQLWQRLNQERKTTLLCLDDVWERMELVEVGIPYKNAGNSCKVIFTTRIQGVCESMEMDEKIEVKVLSEEDSWNLFRSKAGGVVDLFKTVAGNIVKECKGLPLAIVTLGLALRNKGDIAVWNDTLARLKKSISEKMEPVNASIRLSYYFLQDETTKMCFLFCCMFPEDFEIPPDVLFGYMMGEKLIRDVNTFEEARNRLQATVEKLTSAGLLLKDDDESIMMHDVVRDEAVSIAKCEERNEFIVKAKMSFDEWPDMELEKCKRLSLMDTKIRYHPLPSQIKAPNLLTLSLNGFNDLNEIPSNFFQEMTNLLTLDLSNTKIRSLPASLSSLTNLRTLRMNECSKLTNISPVVKLNRLEILYLNESGIEN
ncbi:hypothetical protein IFM89_036958 [Coptis chinensis]|uniref:AAA+ ATPase domain-containing protein n=1 Tax=Coptis chinensis TaxID=261450 RepID=A0A835HGQ7_9MAGN|nr:hypothetical protein IFM89_036958 [Coptis chinensis]